MMLFWRTFLYFGYFYKKNDEVTKNGWFFIRNKCWCPDKILKIQNWNHFRNQFQTTKPIFYVTSTHQNHNTKVLCRNLHRQASLIRFHTYFFRLLMLMRLPNMKEITTPEVERVIFFCLILRREKTIFIAFRLALSGLKKKKAFGFSIFMASPSLRYFFPSKKLFSVWFIALIRLSLPAINFPRR